MAWTAPRTWVVAEVVTAAIMNTHVRDDLRYLKGLDGVPTIENGLIVDNSLGTEYLTVPSLTTTQRDALTPVNGMIIYNSTLTVFERYEAGAWVSYTNLAAMTIASIAQGDIFFRGASVIQRLAADAGKILQSQAAAPQWVTGIGALNSGQYTGNDTANRGIAHGLGVIPKFVCLYPDSASATIIVVGINGQGRLVSSVDIAVYAVTAPDATNFYVGSAGSYVYSGNANGVVHDWFAIS